MGHRDNHCPVHDAICRGSPGLVIWAAILVFGPSVLWISLLAASADSLWQGWRRSRLKQDAFWLPLSFFTQEAGSNILASLVALSVYRATGGAFPLAGLQILDWLPAIYAMLVDAFLPGIILLPIITQFNRLMGIANSLKGAAAFILGVALPTLFMTPFAILASLLFTLGGFTTFFFFLLAVFLVNLLAYHLSRTNERSEQQARELAHLELLGEAIIQAPADASTLRDVLTTHISVMFPQEMVAIHLFAPADMATPQPIWPTFELLCPTIQPPIADTVWQQLRQTAEPYFILRDTILPGMKAVYGDAIVVKIVVETPEIKPDRQSTTVGGVYLLRQRAAGKTTESLAAVQSLASQIGAALYRAQVYAETVAHQKVAQELALAGRIQATFLPEREPQVDGWDIAATLLPARETSGDFYDFVPLAGDRIGLLVADVADKGTGAALYMALSRTLIRTYAMAYPTEPERALGAANERILADTGSDQFVTVFYAVLEPESGLLTYANAGHNPAYVVRSQANSAPQELARTGIPLGMFEGMHWRQHSLQLEPGDVLVLYTDGVCEAQDGQGVEFGPDRLLAVVNANKHCSALLMQSALMQAINDFVGSAPQFDDITLMIAIRIR